MAKVYVDRISHRCGLCADQCPNVFVLEDDGKAEVTSQEAVNAEPVRPRRRSTPLLPKLKVRSRTFRLFRQIVKIDRVPGP